MSTSYEEKLCEAIETIALKAVADAGYDKTIQAVILSYVDEETGKYKVKYQDSTFYAYSTDPKNVTYSENTSVYVLIPKSDMSSTKTIIGSVKKLGTDYVKETEDADNFEVIGNNIISTSEEDLSFNLCSFKNLPNGSQIYKYGAEDNVLEVDNIALAEYLSNADAIRIGATFKTSLPDKQKYQGNYGLYFECIFSNSSEGGDDYSQLYYMDINNMTGNPYNYVSSSTQTRDCELKNGKNFKYINRIVIFNKDFFYQEDNQEDDIFISDLTFEATATVTETQMNTYFISFITPYGYVFGKNDLLTDVIRLAAQVKVKNKIITAGSSSLKYYWFRENYGISAQSENYNRYGGVGWECLNDATITEPTEEGGKKIYSWSSGRYYIETTKGENPAKNTRYKCVVLYEDNIMSREITIKNLGSDYDISIISDSGSNFYYDNGGNAWPSLTCLVNTENEDLSSGVFTYCWGVESAAGDYEALNETTSTTIEYNKLLDQKAKFDKLVENGTYLPNSLQYDSVYTELLTNIENYDKILRVEGNKIYHIDISEIINFSTYRCSVFWSKGGNTSFLGSGSIILKNIYGDENYTLRINNGIQVFNYNEAGVSPASDNVDNPMTLLPLSYTIYDPSGNALDESILRKCENVWSFPLEDTMLETISAYDGYLISDSDKTIEDEEYNEMTEALEALQKMFINQECTWEELINGEVKYPDTDEGHTWTEWISLRTQYRIEHNITTNIDEDIRKRYHNTYELGYALAAKYNSKASYNNIDLTVTYNGMNLKASTDFTFTKEGEDGTNGTDYVLRIVPYSITKFTEPFVAMINGNLNYNLVHNGSGRWFKAQLYHNGVKVFDADESGTSDEGDTITLTWEVLKQTYNSKYPNFSNYIVEEPEEEGDHWTFSYVAGEPSQEDATDLANYDSDPSNIIKCTILRNGSSKNKYTATIPIVTITTNKDVTLNWKNNSGFKKAMYSYDGKDPEYDDTYPFELEVTETITSQVGDENGENLVTVTSEEDILSLEETNKYKAYCEWEFLGDKIEDKQYKDEINLSTVPTKMDTYQEDLSILEEEKEEIEEKYNYYKDLEEDDSSINYQNSVLINFMTSTKKSNIPYYIKLGDYINTLNDFKDKFSEESEEVQNAITNIINSMSSKVLVVYNTNSNATTSYATSKAVSDLISSGSDTDDLDILRDKESGYLFEMREKFRTLAFSSTEAAQTAWDNLNELSNETEVIYQEAEKKDTYLSAIEEKKENKQDDITKYNEAVTNKIISSTSLLDSTFDSKSPTDDFSNNEAIYKAQLEDKKSEIENLDPMNYNPLAVKPNSIYTGENVNNGLRCKVYQNETLESGVILKNYIATIHIPIHFYYNVYGFSSLNDWDGTSIDLGKNSDMMILSPQMGAGSKGTGNTFNGVVLGDIKETKDSGATSTKSGMIGLHNGIQTFFLDAESGAATFGSEGNGQIKIIPGETNSSAIIEGGNYSTSAKTGMQIDLSKPSITFGSGNFSVDKDGLLTANNAVIKGNLLSGSIGSTSEDNGWVINGNQIYSKYQYNSSPNFTLDAKGNWAINIKPGGSEYSGYPIFGVTKDGLVHAHEFNLYYDNNNNPASIFIWNNSHALGTTIDGTYVNSSRIWAIDTGGGTLGSSGGNCMHGINPYSRPGSEKNLNDHFGVYCSGSEWSFWFNGDEISNSDERVKRNIQDLQNLDLLQIAKEIKIKQFRYKSSPQKIHFGVIAQELIALCEKYNIDFRDFYFVKGVQHVEEEGEEPVEYYAVDYSELTMLECKYLQSKIEELENKYNNLNSRLENLENKD